MVHLESSGGGLSTTYSHNNLEKSPNNLPKQQGHDRVAVVPGPRVVFSLRYDPLIMQISHVHQTITKPRVTTA